MSRTQVHTQNARHKLRHSAERVTRHAHGSSHFFLEQEQAGRFNAARHVAAHFLEILFFAHFCIAVEPVIGLHLLRFASLSAFF